jgi:hypothetical protein
MGADTVACWILALPAVAAFYLAYGVVEKIIRKRRSSLNITERAALNSKPSTIESPRKADMPPAVRGYDTPELFRQDALIHIRHLDAQVAEHERNIQAILAEMKTSASQISGHYSCCSRISSCI